MGSYRSKPSQPGPGSDLTTHPNFEIPTPPSLGLDQREIFLAGMRWALECAANMVSPPKISGENDEFRCEEVAASIRGPLRGILTSEVLKVL